MLFHLILSSCVLLLLTDNASSLTILNNGTSKQIGLLPNGLQWQASGILTQGCTVISPIQNCYDLSLGSNPAQELDPGFTPPRQRVEFRAPSQAPGTTYLYSWKHYLAPNVSSSATFFYLMQIKSNALQQPYLALNVAQNSVRMRNFIDPTCGVTGCPSINLTTYAGRTTTHTMRFTAGSNGTAVYLVQDTKTGAALLSYSTTGDFGNTTVAANQTFVKFGIYRSVYAGMSAVNASAGDYSSKKCTSPTCLCTSLHRPLSPSSSCML